MGLDSGEVGWGCRLTEGQEAFGWCMGTHMRSYRLALVSLEPLNGKGRI